MATQVSLGSRGEPADLEIRIGIPATGNFGISILGGNKKGCFRQIVLSADGLHCFRIKPAFERHNGGGVTGIEPVGEGINLIQW